MVPYRLEDSFLRLHFSPFRFESRLFLNVFAVRKGATMNPCGNRRIHGTARMSSSLLPAVRLKPLHATRARLNDASPRNKRLSKINAVQFDTICLAKRVPRKRFPLTSLFLREKKPDFAPKDLSLPLFQSSDS